MSANGSKGPDEVMTDLGFCQVPTRSRVSRRLCRLCRLELGDDQNFCVWVSSQDPPCCFQAVQSRHADIHQDDLRIEFLDLLQRLVAVPGLTAKLKGRLHFQETPERLPYRWLVIYNQDASRFGFERCSLNHDACTSDDSAFPLLPAV